MIPCVHRGFAWQAITLWRPLGKADKHGVQLNVVH